MSEKLPVIHAASGSRVGCITLSIGNVLFLVNRVQVTGLPQELIEPIRQCITSTLGPIQMEFDDFGAHDFRFQAQVLVQHQDVFGQDEWFAIGFDNRDRVRIIEAPDVIAPLVREAIHKHWDGEAGILNASLGADDSVEFRLKATPFMNFSVENSVKVQLLMGQIITNIKTANYKLYAMIDSVGVHSNSDLATWVFRKTL
ncbi:hypothetical protein BGZ59_008080 [Podila verticillata]|nr:hypothetical protein BGZ59_008080 [Podila verticillata]